MSPTRPFLGMGWRSRREAWGALEKQTGLGGITKGHTAVCLGFLTPSLSMAPAPGQFSTLRSPHNERCHNKGRNKLSYEASSRQGAGFSGRGCQALPSPALPCL